MCPMPPHEYVLISVVTELKHVLRDVISILPVVDVSIVH
jgi:hypothetical protein